APSLLKAMEFTAPPATTQVAFGKTTDSAAGVRRAIDLLGLDGLRGKDFFLNPNCNSADATRASPHQDTLTALVRAPKELRCGTLTIRGSSAMSSTREVMEIKSAFTLGKEFGVSVVVFVELKSDGW